MTECLRFAEIRAGLDVLHGAKLCIGLDAAYALSAIRAELVELNVSQVDLVLLHAPCDSDTKNANLWKGMDQALALNLTRAIGVSNYPKKQLGALLAVATDQIWYFLHADRDSTEFRSYIAWRPADSRLVGPLGSGRRLSLPADGITLLQ